jgi:hypothetical protein
MTGFGFPEGGGLKSLVIMLLKSEKEANKFAEWAFGKDYKDFLCAEKFMLSWNELHGDIYTCLPNGSVASDLIKMTELFKLWEIKKSKISTI